MYTIQIAQHRVAKEKGIFFLDTTVKSGDPVFAPTWDIVMSSKSGQLSNEDYTRIYLGIMRDSYRDNKDRWLEVCNMERVAVACYCAHGKFCHRHILVDVFCKVCLHNTISFTHMGELKGSPKK